MEVTFKLETFEGPLDLLLHLIDKAEVDIYDIPIKEITDQYLLALQGMQELEMEFTSEFLVMAATLLAIKSKMLLPKPPVELDLEGEGWDDADGEYDPRSELVHKLIEYRKYKEIADHLREKEVERGLIYTREALDLTPYEQASPVTNPVEGLGLSDLLLAFRKALRKQSSRNRITTIHRDHISVKERIQYVAELLQKSGGKALFSSLLSEDNTREEIVVTFLALLELMKLKQIVCYQHSLFEDIVIQARGDEIADAVAEIEIDY